jgi:hypothetical protein
VNIIIAAGFCLLIPPVYFLRLMADARRLEAKLQERAAQINENAQEHEAPLIKLDSPAWTAWPIYSKTPSASSDQPQAS